MLQEDAAEAVAALSPGGWLLPGGERASGAELAELRAVLQTADPNPKPDPNPNPNPNQVLQTAERLMDEATGFVEAAELPDAASVGEWLGLGRAVGASG